MTENTYAGMLARTQTKKKHNGAILYSAARAKYKEKNLIWKCKSYFPKKATLTLTRSSL